MFSRSSDTKTILVQNSILQDKMSCNLPFSWRIRSYLEELWVHALQQEGKDRLGVFSVALTFGIFT